MRIDRISAAHISDLAEHAEVIRARLDWLDQNHAALEAVKAGADGIKVETTLTNPVTGKKAKVVEFITPSPEGEAICDIGKRLEAARLLRQRLRALDRVRTAHDAGPRRVLHRGVA